jgi:hypothetical protein
MNMSSSLYWRSALSKKYDMSVVYLKVTKVKEVSMKQSSEILYENTEGIPPEITDLPLEK